MKDSLYKNVSKKFLNDDIDEYGAICFEVESSRYTDKEKYRLSANLRLQDCHHNINLDFYVGRGTTNERFQNRIKKIDVMIEELRSMKDQLIVGYNKTVEANASIEEPEESD